MPGRESPNEYIDQYEWGLVVGLDNVEELPILLDQRMNLPDLNWNFKEIKRFWKELFIDTIPCSENEFLSFNPTYILLKDAHNKMVGAYVNGKPTIHIRYKMDFKKRLERIIRKIKEGKDEPINEPDLRLVSLFSQLYPKEFPNTLDTLWDYAINGGNLK